MKIKLLLFTLFFCTQIFGQVDSVVIKISWDMQFSNNQWMYTSLRADSFSGGLHTSSLNQYWDNTSWANNSLTSYNYTGNLPDEILNQSWLNNQWTNVDGWLYIHSSTPDSAIYQTWSGIWDNNKLEATWKNSIGLDSVNIESRWINSAWSAKLKTDYLYAADSTMSSSVYSRWDSASMQWDVTGRTIYTYNNHNLVSQIDQSDSSGFWINRTFYSDLYQMADFDFWGHIADWSNLDSAFTFSYGSTSSMFDTVSHQLSIYSQGIPGGFSDRTVYYDSLWRVSALHAYSESMGGFPLEDSSHWYYMNYPDTSVQLSMINTTYTICDGDTVYANAVAFGGTGQLHYQWTPSTGLSSDSIPNPVIAVNSLSTYFLTVTDDSLNTASDSVVIHVNQPATANVVSVNPTCNGCGDGGFIFNPSGSGPFTIWLDTNQFIISGDTISGLFPGIYVITIEDSNECQSTFTDTIFSPSIGVFELSNDSVNVYPNPSSKSFVVRSKYYGKNVSLLLYDINGKLIRKEIIDAENKYFERKELSCGTFIGKIYSNDKLISVIKLIVED
jgi:hypothetical protein